MLLIGSMSFYKFGKEPPKDHFCEVSIESDNRLQRRRLKKQKLTDRSTEDERKVITIAYLVTYEHSAVR